MTGNPAPLEPGDPAWIGRYRLVGQLGKGGMGTVYLGEDEQGGKVAIKVINADLATQQAFRTRFRREAEAAQKVRRFCTAAVLDASLEGDALYVVNEYVPGPTLDDAVRESGPLQGSSLEALAVGVATALSAIHGAGVIHRDLKPSNVLLSPVGPRVIDFGIARALDTLGDATRTGEIIGTPLYMAPEALRGEPATPACDIFSWGCLVTFAGTGQPPFTGDSMPTVLYHILSSEPQLDRLDPALRDLVAAALAKDPQRRPSAQELMNRMVGHTDGAQAASTMAAAPWAATANMGAAGGPPATQPYPGRTAVQHPPGPPGPPQTLLAHAQPAPGSGGPRARSPWKLPLLAGGAAVVLVAALIAAFMFISSGPPKGTAPVFSDDFANSRSGWGGGTYTPDSSQSGYQSDGTYAVDASGESGWTQRKFETAPLPTEPTPSPAEDGEEPAQRTPDRLLISVDAKAREASAPAEYGLWCRGQDGGGYHFLVDVNGNARIKREVNEAGGAIGGPVNIGGFDPKESHRIQAACDLKDAGAMQLTLWVDGSEVIDVTDTAPLPNGSVGLTSQVPGEGDGLVKVSFDNFAVSNLG